MTSLFRTLGLGLCAATLAACAAVPPMQTAAVQTGTSAPAPASGLVDVRYQRLDNGLRVVLAPDSSVPTVTIGVYYNIGFRIEPKGQTGFAHLFEHLMFQGSANLPKGAFDDLVSGNGGKLNGSTRFDYTNYYQVVPSHLAEAVVWAEADRMRGLAITEENLQNQKDVVKNEVKVNVLNQPYGGFIWLDMPQYAFSNFYNAHNFYGDLDDIDAATLDQALTFHDRYYPPNNAVIVLAGDVDADQALGWVQRYFGSIAARDTGPLPDLTEPPQSVEKMASRIDPLAPRPGLAFAYRVPERGSADYFAFGILEDLLVGSDDAHLIRSLVRGKGYTSGVSGGINALLGNQFDYNGPMLMTFGLIHDPGVSTAQIMAEVDAVMLDLQTELVPQADIDRVITGLRSSLYDVVASPTRFGLVDLLASFALFDDDPARINDITQKFAAVTPEQVRDVARRYLVPSQRTVLELKPGSAAPEPAAGAGQ